MKNGVALFVIFLSTPIARAVVPDIPPGPNHRSIARGLLLLSHTHENLKEYVSAEMNCTSCHLNGGTSANAAPWVGVTQVYPKYNAREGRIISIQDRVNECFVRSLNGKPLPPSGSDMRDIVSYLSWLSRKPISDSEKKNLGFKIVSTKTAPNFTNGVQMYLKQCASCHGVGGTGVMSADHKIMYPPLWGEHSFNIGAGMARLNNATSFIKWNMPLGQGGGLKDQDAKDIAAYVIQQPRPDFKNKKKDWPKGNKPVDARY